MMKRIALVLGTAALLAGGAAHAALVKQDLLTVGDGLVTLDTTTHLEWLNLTATQDLSVDQVLGGTGGWVNIGFQYASYSQVGQLLNDAGYLGSTSDYSTMRLVADNLSANAFLSDFGSTSPLNFTFGFMSPYPCGRIIGTATSCTDYVEINANGAESQGYAIPDSGAFGTDTGRAYVGSFLIRSVPEPETYATMIAGLGLLAALTRALRARVNRESAVPKDRKESVPKRVAMAYCSDDACDD
jgi:hypothetical protein